MELSEVILKRRSIRKYTDKVIEKNIIGQLIESARLAPSAVNFQPCMFYICTSEESKKAVRDSYPREWFNAAQLYIVVCGNHDESWKRPSDGKDHCDIDIAIAVEHICLTATDLGLGTCWVCNFDARKLKSGLQLPENLEPVVILPLGYPIEEAPTGKRKSAQEIVRWI